jgi:hypothetical protein
MLIRPRSTASFECAEACSALPDLPGVVDFASLIVHRENIVALK